MVTDRRYRVNEFLWTQKCSERKVKIVKGVLLTTILALLLLCSCTMTRSDISSNRTESALTNASAISPKTEAWGTERVFTNAHVVMKVPSRAKPVWDGPTLVVHIDETTPPGAFVKDYKIEVEIQIVNTTEELQNMKRWAALNWYFQEHLTLSIQDGQAGRQMRKDIWDPERKWRLLINALVERSNTFDEDVEITKKMIESIRLIKVQPDDTDFFNPLTVAEVDQVKREIDHLQPYMTIKDCVVAFGIPLGKIAGSVSGPRESQSTSMTLREGHVLLLACDNRGYVIFAQLEDKKWEWKKDETVKKP